MGFWTSTLESLEVNLDFWKNKKVFITGNTGFKGSWLSLILLKLNCNIVGYSFDPPTKPSLFNEID